MFKRAPARSIALFAIMLAAGSIGSAADLVVESLQLVTHGDYDSSSDQFIAGTQLYYQLDIRGGDKFSGLLRFQSLNGDIESSLPTSAYATVAALSPQFETAAVTAKGTFGLPLDATYFVGYLDAFCAGDDFVSLFGTAPFATTLRGPMVYPNGIYGNPNRYYNGIHAVNGTGFRLATSPRLSSNLISYLYVYQDSDIGVGSWSSDLRGLLNYEHVKLEVFAGATTTSGASDGIYRGGLMFFAAPGDVGEFFAQIGVPHFDPLTGFSIDDVYFLFEPRMNFGIANLALTVFYHPTWYRQQETNEKDALDAALNLRFGKLAQDGAQGGLEGMLEFRGDSSSSTAPLTVIASPYYSAIAGGIEWDFKLSLQLLPVPSKWYGIFEPFVGLKTSF